MPDTLLRGRPFLIAVAAPAEAAAVLRGLGATHAPAPPPRTPTTISPRADLLVTGVGKANAAAALARIPPDRYAAILSLGLAGSLPAATAPLAVGTLMAADACVLADEGVETPDGFLSLSAIGFPADPDLGECFPTDPDWTRALAALAGAVGICATVSSCSGTDARAAEIARRTGALAEDMESAALALAAHHLSLPFACLRVISNRTGNRASQAWNLPLALAALERAAGSL